MCKLFYATNITLDQNQQKKILSILGKGQPDGLGIVSQIGEDVHYYRNSDTENAVNSINRSVLPDMFPINEKLSSSSELIIPNHCDSLFIHSRFSTNEYSLDACHPFELNNTYFAHNGIITIPDHNFPTKTTNDSEYFAHIYNKDTISSLENFKGYAATMRYNIDTGDMGIYRDDKATLFIAFSVKLNSTIITTQLKDLTNICNIISDDFSVPQLLKDDTFFTLKQDNTIINIIDVKREKAKINVSKDTISKSLGTNFVDNDTNLYDIPSNSEMLDTYNDGYNDGYDDGYDKGYEDAVDTMNEDLDNDTYNEKYCG